MPPEDDGVIILQFTSWWGVRQRLRPVAKKLVPRRQVCIIDRRMTRMFLILLALLGLCLMPPGPLSARPQTLAELQEPPRDRDEAQRLRIWFPIQRQGSCRVTVSVLDSSGTIVRQLLSRLMSDGYYNIYWDKRDDSGRLVPPGVYPVRINDCGKIQDATVTAVYRPYERETELWVESSEQGLTINVKLPEDSLAVAFHVQTLDKAAESYPIMDTALTAGHHQLPLKLSEKFVRGQYLLQLLINDSRVRETKFLYQPD